MVLKIPTKINICMILEDRWDNGLLGIYGGLKGTNNNYARGTKNLRTINMQRIKLKGFYTQTTKQARK